MLPAFFFLIALFYSMVGFGGGSSYLAILVLAGYSYQMIPVVALVCNLVVTTGGCWHFYRAGHLKMKLVLPFAVSSIPMAYIGGTMMVSKTIFCLLLGGALLMVAFRMFLSTRALEQPKEISWKESFTFGLPMGAALGLLAGVVGIGGGIFLSPILLLMGWAHVKEAAAAASLFIVVNSVAGLLGHAQKEIADIAMLLPLLLAVLIGGQIGSCLGAYKVPKIRLQQALGVLVFLASAKLILEVV